jgi:dTDP-glucose 4,6-dehydratase
MLLETTRIYNDETHKIEKFIHVSTDEVYGQVIDNEARIENSLLDPTNPYAASKASAENYVRSYHKSHKLPCVITRGNNVLGINQYPEKIIAKFICRLLDGKKLTIHGNGSSRRNFIHVDDTCTAFETILLKGEIGETYNISSDHSNEYSVMEIAKMLVDIMHPGDDLEKYIEYVEDRKFNDARYFISSDKLNKLGWKPQKTNFIQNLKELIEWYRINKSRYPY